MNRRHVLAAPAALLAAAPAIARAAGAAGTVPAAALEAATAGPLAAFRALPGEKSYLVVAGDPASGWRAAHRPAEPMFVGSAVKTFILATWLRAVEKGALSEDTMMAIDDSVRSLVSPVFIELSGRTAARNVLEAMIAHSDNTATDVALKAVGPDNVRRFIADAGLKHTLIPDSTRRLFSWLAGAAPGEDLGWVGMVRLAKQDRLPNARQAINDTQTMMSTSEELVDYYRRALQGEFFTKPESLTEFRRIQGMADAIANVMPPNIPTYAKGGSIDWNGFLAVSLPGQAWVGGVPVGFSFTLNWNQKDGDMDAMMPKLRAAVYGVMAGIVTALA